MKHESDKEIFKDLYEQIDINNPEDVKFLDDCIEEEIDYLLAEGFGERMTDGTFRFFTEEEIDLEVERASR